jgi:Holliday junction resolvase RusA-like endonuclease
VHIAAIQFPGIIRIAVPGLPKPLERNRHRIMRGKAGTSFVVNYLPAKSRNEQAVIRDFAQVAMQGRAPCEGAVELRVVLWLPVPLSWSKKKQEQALGGVILPTGKPDFDNLVKQLCDALKGIVWRDDAQVVDAFIWKRYSSKPEMVAEIRPLD